MSEQTQWGVLLLVYVLSVLPLAIKSLDNDAREEAQKKFYPGRVVDEQQGERLTKFFWIWVGGLALLLAAYKTGWGPIVAVITLFGSMLSIFAVRFALKRWAAGKPASSQKRTILDTQTNSSISQKILELQGLRNDELITEEEFQKKKQQLLEKF